VVLELPADPDEFLFVTRAHRHARNESYSGHGSLPRRQCWMV